MPKPLTYPTLFDECKTINITFLKKQGFLEPDQFKKSTLTWNRLGEQTGSISILVCTYDSPYIELSYTYNDEPRKSKIYLVSIPSNLGKGEIWYFLSPHTNKRCRILYLIDGYFLHREAFRFCMYESQRQSKHSRNFNKILGMYFDTDQIYKQLYSKLFKKFYAGKPTKKYVRLMTHLKQAERIPYSEIERLIIR